MACRVSDVTSAPRALGSGAHLLSPYATTVAVEAVVEAQLVGPMWLQELLKLVGKVGGFFFSLYNS